MEDNKTKLVSRGYITKEIYNKYSKYSEDELYKLIHSHIPFEQSVAIKLLTEKGYINNEKFVEEILGILKNSPKLYTKIQICETLELGDSNIAKKMIKYLGKIGNNQYKELPDVVSKKKCYPLARDIIARTLGRMSPSTFKTMMEELEVIDTTARRELIDAIGYIVFYNRELDTVDNLKSIIKFMNTCQDEIVFWKCIRCLSAFWVEESTTYLKRIVEKKEKNIFVKEALRSIQILERRSQ